MIIVKLNGGLGNQMFQYAYARNLALNKGTNLLLDTYSYTKDQAFSDTPREYLLGKFNTVENIATAKDLHKIKHEISLGGKIWRKIQTVILRKPAYDIYNRIYKGADKNFLYLDGYWQSEKYFAENRSTILNEFKLKENLSLEATKIAEIISRSSVPVSLHIRRGDYVKNKDVNKILSTQPLDYYYKSIDLIKNKIKDPEFFVFSDDIEWAKENLKLNFPTHFVSNPGIKDYEEIVLMSKCSHNIIANSSFSWWGAWLNQNPDKIVGAPARWYNNASFSSQDIIPDSWIKI